MADIVVWLLESSGIDEKLAPVLTANFPTRVFASLDSLEKICQLQGSRPPTAIVVSCDSFTPSSISITDERLALMLPDVDRIFVRSHGQPVPKSLDLNRDPERKRFEFCLLQRNELVEFLLNFRANSQLRHLATSNIVYKDLSLDLVNSRLRLICNDEAQALSSTEARLLGFFLQNSGEAVTRTAILRHVWSDLRVSESTINSHISRLRKRLSGSDVEIESVYGGAYILR